MLNMQLIDTETIQAFQRDGAVVLRGALHTMQLMQLEFGIEHNLANRSPLALTASQSDDPGLFVEDFCTWQTNEHYESILKETALPWIARDLMQSQSVRIYHDHLLVKEGGTRAPTPWHQDQPYYNIAGRQNVSFWIPVDPVPSVSSLRLIAGSHSGPWFMPRTFRDAQAKWFPEGALQELPDIENGLEAEPPQFNELCWALEPGDCVAFHMLTLHATRGTAPDQRRRVFSARYMGDDTRHAVRPWRTSPPFEGLAHRLPDGAEMNDELFARLI
jgi:ectoine hydroxylase-related dioxygenase (phytanoyl-CoA dioxygenase family)